MNEIEQLTRHNQRTFFLVCANFAMLLVLFFGFGYVMWQSASLVSNVKADLARAEQAVAQLQQKIQTMDMDEVMGKVMQRATEGMGESIKTAIKESEFSGTLGTLAERIDNAQDKLGNISESLKAANEKLDRVDTKQLAQLVSYNMLLGMGNGFTSAAEANKPSSLEDEGSKSSTP